MKPPVLMGAILGVVVLAAGFIVPPLFRSPGATVRDALTASEQARRELSSFDLPAATLARRVDPAQLKSADLAKLVEASQEQFKARETELGEITRHAQDTNRRRGMPPPRFPSIGANPQAVQSAIDAFQAGLKQDQALLADATRRAQSANQSAGQTPGVAYTLGMAELVRAATLAAEARELRLSVHAAQADVLDTAIEWRRLKAEADGYADFDVKDILGKLGADRDEVAAAARDAESDVAKIEPLIREREQQLAAVRKALADGRNELLALEREGFRLGDDAAFQAYRQRYSEISARLAAAQEEEQRLALGGVRGAAFEEDETELGAASGGQVEPGLAELKRELDVARARSQRLNAALASLDAKTGAVEQVGESSRQSATRYEPQLAALRTALDEKRAALQKLETQAAEKESDALKAAQSAAAAFSGAERAVQSWISAAREAQSKSDPQRANERLKKIVADTAATRMAQAARAEARVAAGWVYYDRCAALLWSKVLLERLAALLPGGVADTTTIDADIAAAREEGVKALHEARDLYDKLAAGGGVTSWVPQAALASVHYLLSKIDPAQAETARDLAAQTIAKAVDKREKSPYLEWYVRLRDHLGAPKGAPSGEQPSDENGEQPADSGDGG